ncbi:hypothetical protein ES288_A03G093000v1 [Gossypium darwinii]|uniref:Uncharacterized protein n=2 Tax=Gossypium TaxID=3633 RepID=A0A5D2R4U0_GOSTO|nr:hypothetical protein ES288_A03G093000v1 [Gossypium darwinii]TYI35699.1 hypothetical protein ES332_A03G093200v1 [Gossypium tomentosum]
MVKKVYPSPTVYGSHPVFSLSRSHCSLHYILISNFFLPSLFRFLYIFSIRLYLKTGRSFNGHSTTIFDGKVIRSPRKRRIFLFFVSGKYCLIFDWNWLSC